MGMRANVKPSVSGSQRAPGQRCPCPGSRQEDWRCSKETPRPEYVPALIWSSRAIRLKLASRQNLRGGRLKRDEVTDPLHHDAQPRPRRPGFSSCGASSCGLLLRRGFRLGLHGEESSQRWRQRFARDGTTRERTSPVVRSTSESTAVLWCGYPARPFDVPGRALPCWCLFLGARR